MIYGIGEAVFELNRQIKEIEDQISFLVYFDYNKPVTEEVWHKLCDTPLRNSEFLKTVVSRTFHMAENISVGANYVYFDMLGFEVQIPTSRARGINVDTSWYRKNEAEPTFVASPYLRRMLKYLDAVSGKHGWYECAKYRIHDGELYSKWALFLLWWFKYKWNPVDKDFIKEKFDSETRNYKKRVAQHKENKQTTKEKAKTLVNELLPIIDTFSSKHSTYEGRHGKHWSDLTIEEIKELENL